MLTSGITHKLDEKSLYPSIQKSPYPPMQDSHHKSDGVDRPNPLSYPIKLKELARQISIKKRPKIKNGMKKSLSCDTSLLHDGVSIVSISKPSNNCNQPSNNIQPSKELENNQFIHVYESAVNSLPESRTRDVLNHLLKEYTRLKTQDKCTREYVEYIQPFLALPSKMTCNPTHNPELAGKESRPPRLVESFGVGMNDDFQLGLGPHDIYTGNFKKTKLMDNISDAERKQMVQLACGAMHSVSLDEFGIVYTWGFDELIGRDGDAHTPQAITSIPNPVVQIAAGEYITLCLDSKGSVWSWGGFRTASGERVGVIMRPTIVNFVNPSTGKSPKIVQISTGESHALALDDQGNSYAWGALEFGQGGQPPCLCLVPQKIVIHEKIQKVFATGLSSYFISFNGTVYACGNNGFGEMGVGDDLPRYYPTRLQFPRPIKSIAGGLHHTLFLDYTSNVYGCGKNIDGQLGLGLLQFTNVPTKITVPGMKNTKAVLIGAGTSSQHSCKLLFINKLLQCY